MLKRAVVSLGGQINDDLCFDSDRAACVVQRLLYTRKVCTFRGLIHIQSQRSVSNAGSGVPVYEDIWEVYSYKTDLKQSLLHSIGPLKSGRACNVDRHNKNIHISRLLYVCQSIPVHAANRACHSSSNIDHPTQFCEISPGCKILRTFPHFKCVWWLISIIWAMMSGGWLLDRDYWLDFQSISV